MPPPAPGGPKQHPKPDEPATASPDPNAAPVAEDSKPASETAESLAAIGGAPTVAEPQTPASAKKTPTTTTHRRSAEANQSWVPKWVLPASMILTTLVGLVLLLLVLIGWRSIGETTTVSECDITQPTASPSGIAAQLSSVESPAPCPPSTLPLPGEGASVTSKNTQTDAVPSDALIGTLLGVAVLLIVAGPLLPRITKIILPGGAEIDIAELAGAAADAVTHRAPAHHTKSHRRQLLPGSDEEYEAAVQVGSRATADTLTRGQRLLANPTDPSTPIDLSRDEVEAVRRGVITGDVWEKLADDALKHPTSTHE